MKDGFKIALVHSPELYDVAADCGFDFYFTPSLDSSKFIL